MYVYLDLVMILNFLVDFLLLLGTNRLTGFPPGIKGAVLASILGGIYGGACLMPGFYFLGNLLWRMVSLILMAGIAFGWNPGAIRRGAVFVLLSMALGGLALGMTNRTFWMLVLAALALWGLCRAGFGGRLGEQEYIQVTICHGGKKILLWALQDTGNCLRDPLTGEQVLVAGADVAWELLGLSPEQLSHPVETLTVKPMAGLRLVPYRAVGQPGGMMLALRFSDVTVGKRRCTPLIAFAPQALSNDGKYRMLTGGMIG